SSDEQTFDLDDTVKTVFPFTSRRMLFASSTLWFCLHTSKYFPAFSFLERVQKTFEGRLIGANRAKDLAVLKVDLLLQFNGFAKMIIDVNCCDPSYLLTTQSVLLAREEVNTLNGYFGSGGPLLDSKGNMIGINTAIFTNTGMILLNYLHIAGASAGVGFAIPSSTVLRIVPQLIQFGKVGSPYI
ncbi:hypothetical protein B296_00021757, partial [Ensete ventricosum]